MVFWAIGVSPEPTEKRDPMSILRKRSLLAAASVASLVVHWLPTASAQDRELGAGGELLDGVAAVVEEGVVLKSELAERLELVVKNLREQQAQQPPEQRRPLPPVSDHRAASPRSAHRARDPAAARRPRRHHRQRRSAERSAVARRSNLGYTLEELPAVLAAENVDYAAYREDSRQDLMIEQLEQRDVIARIAITPRELEQCSASTRTQSASSRVRLQHLAHLDQRAGHRHAARRRSGSRADRRDPRPARGRRRLRAARRRNVGCADGARRRQPRLAQRLAAADVVRRSSSSA